jgi:hypothetical protein
MILRPMRSCRLQIAILVFAVTWFALVLPGHQRGLIKVPPTQAAAAAESSCCASECEPTAPGEDTDAPAEDPVRTCAICNVIAMMLELAAHEPPPAPPQLTDMIDPPAPVAVQTVKWLTVLSDRGPPADALA